MPVRPCTSSLLLVFYSASLATVSAADLPADLDKEIPASARRSIVVEKATTQLKPPAHALPEGYTLTVAAADPMVRHPLMGCVDDRGRLFIGDAVGVNWNKAQLETRPPNRVLMLEDKDGDGVYDRSTVFADNMTFPQGAAWVDGSLYVCSPPGLWKLTDKDGDGVADERRMIVGGFDYTGNAADVHGPKLHPNGRLYWCHGRKGHEVKDQNGRLVHAGQASGVWSCKPDGSDVAWHSLGCADNPTGLAFTPQGDIIGTTNLYYRNPRGDTLVHWLYGGVYEREDQLPVIAGLPRTLSTMPVIHNFGHIAVSGCDFGPYSSSTKGQGLNLYVTDFNTQRLMRMELTSQGASFKAVENEFLKIHSPDVHLTDVITDRDGSLIVLDTGGWFRIGCPSSLMAKPGMAGAVYRVRGPASSPAEPLVEKQAWKSDWQLKGGEEISAQLMQDDPRALLHALSAAARQGKSIASSRDLLLSLLTRSWEPVLEHAVMQAVYECIEITTQDLLAAREPMLQRRILQILQNQNQRAGKAPVDLSIVVRHLDTEDKDLAATALNMAIHHPLADDLAPKEFQRWVARGKLSRHQLSVMEPFCQALLAQPNTQALVTAMLGSSSSEVTDAALRVLAGMEGTVNPTAWLPMLDPASELSKNRLPLVLDVLKACPKHPYDSALKNIADDAALPVALRLKALDAMKTRSMGEKVFDLLQATVIDPASSSALRIQASSMLGSASLTQDQLQALAPALAGVGPVEMKSLLRQVSRINKTSVARLAAEHLAKNPALMSEQESFYRTAFSKHPPEILETVILPARKEAEARMDAKKRQLGDLAEKAHAEGDVAEGKKHFESGKGTCIACHQIAGVGRSMGPDLTKIGAIRTERDLLESIMFPSNTLARDYETHVIEMSDGKSFMGLVRSHTAEGLLVVDMAGQQHSLPHGQIVTDAVLTTSLMPQGLDTTMTEKELLDLVAYLRSLH